jgi:hypothetical protein
MPNLASPPPRPHMAERAVVSYGSILHGALTAQRVLSPRCSASIPSLPAGLLGWEAAMQHNHPADPRSLRTAPSSGQSGCHMATRHLVLSRYWLRGEMVPVLYCIPSLWTFIRVNDVSRLVHLLNLTWLKWIVQIQSIKLHIFN